MSQSDVFFLSCLFFISGIFLDSFWKVSLVFLVVGFIFGIFWFLVKKPKIGFFILIFCFGALWHQHSLFQISYPKENQEVKFLGKIVKEPEVFNKKQRLVFQPEEGFFFKGKVLIYTTSLVSYQYGDRLEVQGKITPPKNYDDFNYKGYLAKEGIYGVMFWPKIKLKEREKFNNIFCLIYSKILKFKNSLRKSISFYLPQPQSSLLKALTLGDKKQIPKDFKEKLNKTGVRHISAISGMHVGILTAILMSFLVGIGFWKRQAFWITLTVIGFFVLMTGLQPSALRAFLMGSFFLLGEIVGRKIDEKVSLVFAASLLLLKNPLLLRWDIGFQLSFLAMIGIIYFAPLFNNLFKPLPNFKYFPLRNILSLTLGAQVFVLPLIVYNFGHVSLISPLTNILILPTLPYLLIFGFLYAILGAFSHFLGWLLSFPVWVLSTYITKIVDVFSTFSFSCLRVENLHWGWVVFCYIVLGYLAWKISKRKKLYFLNF